MLSLTALSEQLGIKFFTLDSQNPGYAGEDLKVLVMQITTTGSISGQIYVQVFQGGDRPTKRNQRPF